MQGCTRQAGISIHALREEGDIPVFSKQIQEIQFLSTPSARRATHSFFYQYPGFHDFYPRPPRGGRRFQLLAVPGLGDISIHALREEGDLPAVPTVWQVTYFYPRPPRGGRHLRYGKPARAI